MIKSLWNFKIDKAIQKLGELMKDKDEVVE
jgi:hypothetical protein